jgi:hypothetical protein
MRAIGTRHRRRGGNVSSPRFSWERDLTWPDSGSGRWPRGPEIRGRRAGRWRRGSEIRGRRPGRRCRRSDIHGRWRRRNLRCLRHRRQDVLVVRLEGRWQREEHRVRQLFDLRIRGVVVLGHAVYCRWRDGRYRRCHVDRCRRGHAPRCWRCRADRCWRRHARRCFCRGPAHRVSQSRRRVRCAVPDLQELHGESCERASITAQLSGLLEGLLPCHGLDAVPLFQGTRIDRRYLHEPANRHAESG